MNITYITLRKGDPVAYVDPVRKKRYLATIVRVYDWGSAYIKPLGVPVQTWRVSCKDLSYLPEEEAAIVALAMLGN